MKQLVNKERCTHLTQHPCQFCGCGSTSRIRLPDYEVYWIHCDQCQAEGPHKDSLVGAIESWNAATVPNEEQ